MIQKIPFTYANIEEAYLDCSFNPGAFSEIAEHPTTMLVGSNVYPKLMDKLSFMNQNRYNPNHWNKAEIELSLTIGPNEIRFINTHHPNNPRLNCILEFDFIQVGVSN